MDKNYIWPTPTPTPDKKPKEEVHQRHLDELRGRFANNFTVGFNGDDFYVDFSTQTPRRDGKIEVVLASRIFLTKKGLITLHNTMTKVVKQVDKVISNNRVLPPPDNEK